MALYLDQLNNMGQIRRHPSHDVAVIRFGFEPVNLSLNSTSSTSFFGAQPLSDPADPISAWDATIVSETFTNIPDGGEIYILGYPVELLNNNSNMPVEIDYSVPLIRKGIISQRNQQTGKLIIDSGVYGGNSGGPVLIVEHPSFGVDVYKVAGLITQFVPYQTRISPQIGVTNSDMVNSGYGVAEPIDYALELMRQY